MNDHTSYNVWYRSGFIPSGSSPEPLSEEVRGSGGILEMLSQHNGPFELLFTGSSKFWALP